MNAHDAFAAAQDYEAEAPQPLIRETAEAEPFPIAALGPLQEAAEALHDVTQAPPAIGAQSVLGVAALAAQGIADAETLHGRAPASVFLLTVAQSGERKSACDRLAMAPVREFEAELAEIWREARARHRNALDVWETSRRDILKTAKKDPDGARADLDALGPEPEPPLMPSIVAAEPTLEGIAKNMPVLRPALGIFADEGGSFLGGHSMATENRLRTIAGLSSLWDGSPLARWRAGDGVSVFRGRRLSAHLMAQPVAVAGFLADPLATGQGIIARFLIAEPASAIGTRLRTGHDAASDAAMNSFSARIGDLLRHPLPLREGSRNELEPPVLALAPDARAVLQAFALELEKQQAAGRGLEAVRPFASKAAEHAARLAAVLTIYTDPGARTVTGETMADAVALATFYVTEAQRLADVAVISAETADAERMRRWLVGSWAEPFISVTDAAQRGPFKETARARKAFTMLARHGWLIGIEGGAEVLGKHRREAWRIVREGGA